MNATDLDSGRNGEVRYTMARPSSSFYVDELTGTLFANRSEDGARVTPEEGSDVELVVVASDRGEEALTASTAVRVRVGDASGVAPKFTQDEYR